MLLVDLGMELGMPLLHTVISGTGIMDQLHLKTFKPIMSLHF